MAGSKQRPTGPVAKEPDSVMRSKTLHSESTGGIAVEPGVAKITFPSHKQKSVI